MEVQRRSEEESKTTWSVNSEIFAKDYAELWRQVTVPTDGKREGGGASAESACACPYACSWMSGCVGMCLFLWVCASFCAQVRGAGAHRPERALGLVEHGGVDGDGNARLRLGRDGGEAQLQRRVQVGRVHARALPLRTRQQPRCGAATAVYPQLRVAPERRAVLQPHLVRVGIEELGREGVRGGSPQTRERRTLERVRVGADACLAVRDARAALAGAHLDDSALEDALDPCVRLAVKRQRREEEERAQRRRRSANRRARRLHVPRRGEDHAAEEEVVAREGAQAADGARCDAAAAIRLEAEDRVREVAPAKVAAHKAHGARQRGRWRRGGGADTAQYRVRDGASVAKGGDAGNAERLLGARAHRQRGERAAAAPQCREHVRVEDAQLRVWARIGQAQLQRQLDEACGARRRL
eukprot:2768025-Pleurochrysis_carterae.AAC.1